MQFCMYENRPMRRKAVSRDRSYWNTLWSYPLTLMDSLNLLITFFCRLDPHGSVKSSPISNKPGKSGKALNWYANLFLRTRASSQAQPLRAATQRPDYMVTDPKVAIAEPNLFYVTSCSQGGILEGIKYVLWSTINERHELQTMPDLCASRLCMPALSLASKDQPWRVDSQKPLTESVRVTDQRNLSMR